jgi:hypothetical protein
VSDIERVFERLDQWRLLPQYQLERRADIFFSLYLHEVLNTLPGIRVMDKLVPEFPVRNFRVDPTCADFRTFKIDYLVIPETGCAPVFVELKTEERSLDARQLEKTCRAMALGFEVLLGDILAVMERSDQHSRQKYRVLVDVLEANREQLVGGPPGRVVVVRPEEKPLPAFEAHGVEVLQVGFEGVCQVLRRQDDALAQRFEESLERWSS